jgi:tetratricopeptide (TPR) repeat protein
VAVAQSHALAALDPDSLDSRHIAERLTETVEQAAPAELARVLEALEGARSDLRLARERYRLAFRLDPAPDALEGMLDLAYRAGDRDGILGTLAAARVDPTVLGRITFGLAYARAADRCLARGLGLDAVWKITGRPWSEIHAAGWPRLLDRVLDSRNVRALRAIAGVLESSGLATWSPDLRAYVPLLLGFAAGLDGTPALAPADLLNCTALRRSPSAALRTRGGRLAMRLALAQGSLENVRASAGLLTSLDETDADARAGRALGEWRLGGDLVLATREFVRAIDLDPSAAPDLGRGWEVAESLRLARAGRAVDAALARLDERKLTFDPDLPEDSLYHFLADRFLDRGNLEAAIRNAAHANLRLGEFPPVLRRLGLLRLRAGTRSEAIETLARYARGVPDDLEILRILDEYLAGQDPDIRLRRFRLESTDGLRLELARIRLDRGDAKSALDLLTPLVWGTHPTPAARLLLARAYVFLEDLPKAREALAAVGAETAPLGETWLTLALRSGEGNDLETARAILGSEDVPPVERVRAVERLVRRGWSEAASQILLDDPVAFSMTPPRLLALATAGLGNPEAFRAALDRAVGLGDVPAVRDLALYGLTVGNSRLVEEALRTLGPERSVREIRWAEIARGTFEEGEELSLSFFPFANLLRPEEISGLLSERAGRLLVLALDLPGWESFVETTSRTAQSTTSLPPSALGVIRAMALYRQDRPTAALAEIRGVLASDPSHPGALFFGVQICGANGRDFVSELLPADFDPSAPAPPPRDRMESAPLEALAALERAARGGRFEPAPWLDALEIVPAGLRPRAVELCAIGLLRGGTGWLDAAERLTSLAPDDPNALYTFALLRAEAGDSKGRGALVDAALSPVPSWDWLEAAVLRLSDVSSATAVRFLEAARRADPSETRGFRLEAELLDHAGDVSGASASYLRLWDLTGDRRAAYRIAALLAHTRPRPEDDPAAWTDPLPLTLGSARSVGKDLREEARGSEGAVVAALADPVRYRSFEVEQWLKRSGREESLEGALLLAEARLREWRFEEAESALSWRSPLPVEAAFLLAVVRAFRGDIVGAHQALRERDGEPAGSLAESWKDLEVALEEAVRPPTAASGSLPR